MIRADLLLVIDVQRALVTGDHAVPGAAALLDRIGSALDAARAAGAPVVHLQDDGGHLITKGTDGWRLALPAEEGEPVLGKAHDDGFAGTDLDAVLRASRARRLCLVGIQSEMCVAATARGAIARGYTVVLPRDAHATYDVPTDGSAPAVPATHVSRVAEWSLGDDLVAPDRAADIVFGPPEA
jgi:nicotinamidase-related amidase